MVTEDYYEEMEVDGELEEAKPSERALPKSEPRKKELVERSGSPPPAKKAAAAKKEAPKGKVSAAGKMTSFFAKR